MCAGPPRNEPLPEASEEEWHGEVVELFQRWISDASLDDSKPLADAVAEMRRRMVEIGFTPDQIPDVLIEGVILAMRRAEGHGDKKENVRKENVREAWSDNAPSEKMPLAKRRVSHKPGAEWSPR